MVCTKTPSKKGKALLLPLLSLVAFGSLSLSFISGNPTKGAIEVKAEDVGSSETLVGTDSLNFSVSTSASTSVSHSFQCVASSTKIESLGNSSRYNNVFVIPDDPTFPASIAEAKESADAAKKAAEEAGEEYVPVHYNASVFNITNTRSDDTIVIPSTINYTDLFILDVTSIGTSICYDHDEEKASYDNVAKIVIPNTIKSIASGAFPFALEAGVKFCVEASDSTGFAADWTDATDIEYNYNIAGSQRNQLNLGAATTIKTFGQGKDYIIGIEREDYHYPLIVKYQLLDKNNQKYGDLQSLELPITSSNTDYDAVGSNVGSISKSFVVDIDVPEGYHVDDKSLTFHNIYPASRVDSPSGGKVTVPVLEEGPLYAIPRFSFEQTASFETLFQNRPGSITSFGGYTKIGLIVRRELSAYEKLLPRMYRTYESQIKSGAYLIRHQFTALGQAVYHIVYEYNGQRITKDVKVDTPITNAIINTTGEYEVGLLVKDSDVGEGFSASSIKEFDFRGFSVKLDLLNAEKQSRVNKSDLLIRFSSLPLVKEGAVSPNANINLTMVTVLFFLGYALIFTAIALIYYFYAKNKFKNDEFRRVNGKKYLKEAIKNGIGIGLLVGAIFFIYARWGLLESTVVVYNPLDPFVIIFAIAGLIYAGFAIKNIVTSIKNTRKRKEAARLHLDQDKDDDGTN